MKRYCLGIAVSRTVYVLVGFVSIATPSYRVRLDLSFFRYTDVALLLMVYVSIVWTVDVLSMGLRRLAR